MMKGSTACWSSDVTTAYQTQNLIYLSLQRRLSCDERVLKGVGGGSSANLIRLILHVEGNLGSLFIRMPFIY